MKVIASQKNKISTTYLAEMSGGKMVEFVESVQPPVPLSEKWVLIISTLYGCPVKCKMCDAGSSGPYGGILSSRDMINQVDFMVKNRFSDGNPKTEKLKIQFARMGEPAFNDNVIDVLNKLPTLYNGVAVFPSVSTIAPLGREQFFRELIKVKNTKFPQGSFQMQFSLHTTDEEKRDWLVPIKKWDFKKISEFGESFYKEGDRKITLNFALARGMALEAKKLKKYFDPGKYLIKITPLNPTYKSKESGLESFIDPHKRDQEYSIVGELEREGFDVILSIGETTENQVGSNCGLYVSRHLKEKNINKPKGSYDLWQGESSVIF